MATDQLSDKEIFNVARQLASENAVSEYLDQVCGDDAERQTRIKGLLKADHSDSFLEAPPMPLLETIEGREPLGAEGTSIGNYKLL